MPVSFARTKLDALPVVDMEADRLARACGLVPPSIHWTESSSSRGSGRLDEGPAPDVDEGANAPSDPAGPPGWSIRPRARSVRIPQRTTASQGTPSRPRSVSEPASIPAFAPSSPRPVLRSLREILDQEGVQLDGCLDVQHVVERWRRPTSERGLELEASSQGLGAADLKTFGSPVSVAVKCGSMATAMGGFQHAIPWVVFACIEELNRTGIYQPGLFRSVPHRNRLSLLIESFDLPLPAAPSRTLSPEEPICPLVHPTPSITRASLRMESMADICALLKSYLTDLPEPLLDENLTVALYQYCVHPSIVRERLESESTRDPDYGMIDGEYFTSHNVHTPVPSHFAPYAALMTPSEQRTAALSAESSQILIAQHLLRLAPPPLCSLFAYLFGFFTQLPLSPDNGMTLEDVSRMFGRVLSGDSTVSRRHSVLMWLLERWTRISEGLFDVAASKDGDEDEMENTPQT
ncbi:Rho GTPase activation protein, partial [Lentinus tigrinus ALCF2SS1-7]